MIGCPRKYETPEELESAIEAYFDQIKENKDIPLWEELCLELGFADRSGLKAYKKKKEFFPIIEGAKQKCGIILNKMGLKGDTNPTLTKLNLTSNYGYSDSQKSDYTSGGEPVKTTFTLIGTPVEDNE